MKSYQTNKPRIYITRRIPEQAINRLRERCEIRQWDEDDISVPREVLEEEIEQVDGIFTLLTEKLDEGLLRRAKRHKVISNMAVGYNNLMWRRQPGGEYWSPMLLTGQDVHGTTLGIIGMGRIGEAIARRAKGFDMNLFYHNRRGKPEVEERLGIAYAELDQLFRVCVMAPYTPETHHLIGERELSLMKHSAVLINTARGGIVDEQALFEALVTKRIWAAGLDVFEQEPVPLDHPLLTLPNVVMLPPIGSASITTRIKMATLAADNLLQAVLGKVPIHLVNPEALRI